MRTRIVFFLCAAVLSAAVLTPVAAQTYPLKNAPALTYWMNPVSAWSTRFKTLGDTPFGKNLSKATGVPITFIHPAITQIAESFNLMMASGELPDIVEYNWGAIPGGPDKYIRDNYILKLNDVLPKWAPNLWAYLKSHPTVDKMVKTNSGSYYCFPFVRGDKYLQVFQGPLLRKDWLDDLGLPIPVTIDDWTKTLTAFKEKKGATAPFTLSSGIGSWGFPAFVGAYGALKDWYVDDGKIHYGPGEPQYKDFVSLFATWYKDGLIDSNIALMDQKLRDASFASGKSGATVQNVGGGLGYLITLMADKDPKAKFVAAPYPVLKKGDRPKFGQMENVFYGYGAAVSTKTKNLESVIRFLDYGYSPEGLMYYNFGTLGESYNMINGYPAYTEDIIKNSKLTMSQALGEYCRSAYYGPFVQDLRYQEQYSALPEQKAAIKLWGETDMADHILPNLTPDDKDISDFSKIMSEVNTYINEMFTKFVLGAEPIANFDKYIATLKKLNIDRAIAIQQQAYDAYMKR